MTLTQSPIRPPLSNTKSSKSVAVIGAGPAGLTAAYQLAKAGVHVEVFEAGKSVGGMSKTIELWGQKVDLGPHRFFSNDKRVNSVWLEVVGKDYSMVRRLTRILYRNQLFHYPLKPFDALLKLGPWEAIGCVFSYLREKLQPTLQEGSFEDWVVSRFGRRLFNTFFKTYSEKLWGISCKALDADFAAQRIKKFSLGEAIRNALLPKFGKGTKHKTLVDEFAYPHEGSGVVYERMAESVCASGGAVHCQTAVKRVITEDGTVTGIELRDGQIRRFDQVISTMPLTHLISTLEDVPENVREAAGSLRFRNTILVYLKVQGKNHFPDNWFYVHSPDMQMGRITNFRNWTPQLCASEEDTILACEYWCYDQEEMWTQDEASLVELASKEVRGTGLIGKAEVLQGTVCRIPRCYPVYDRGYRERLRPVEQYLSALEGLSVIGRYGAFKYNNQDHSILMGILAAENVAKNARHDLWDINTDYDTYQESAVITRSGLVATEEESPAWEPQPASA